MCLTLIHVLILRDPDPPGLVAHAADLGALEIQDLTLIPLTLIHVLILRDPDPPGLVAHAADLGALEIQDLTLIPLTLIPQHCHRKRPPRLDLQKS